MKNRGEKYDETAEHQEAMRFEGFVFIHSENFSYILHTIAAYCSSIIGHMEQGEQCFQGRFFHKIE